MENLIQTIIVGLSVGGIYGLVALGFTIVYRSLYVINFAQGDVFMVGSFLGYVGFTLASHFPITMFFWPWRRRADCHPNGLPRLSEIHRADHLTFAIASIGVGIIMQNIVRMISPMPRSIPMYSEMRC